MIAADDFATAAAAAGAPAPEGQRPDGVDLLPHVTGRGRGPVHDVLSWCLGPKAAVRPATGNAPATREAGTRWRQFDLAEDLGDAHNLAPARPEKVRAPEQT